MTKQKKWFVVLFSLVIVMGLLAGCTNGNNNGGKSKENEPTATATTAANEGDSKAKTPSKETTLEFYLFSSNGGPPNDLDAVMEQFYKQTKDTLNIKINWHWTTPDQIGQTVNLKLTAGEKVDAMFTAGWVSGLSMNQAVSKGLLTNLDGYFNNDEYPGLKKAFSDQYLNNNKYIDSKNESHIYGVPFSEAFSNVRNIYYRQDLAEKYGIGKNGVISTPAELESYYDAIVANEKGMIPLIYDGATGDNVAGYIKDMYTPVVGTPKQISYHELLIKTDGTPYAAKHWVPELDPEYFRELPPEIQALGTTWYFEKARDWYQKGYVEKDVLSQKTAYDIFKAGKAASFSKGLDTYSDVVAQTLAYNPDAKIGYFVLSEAIRNKIPGYVATDFKAWNFLAVPVSSPNADKVMQFMNWLFEDQKNHDLFQYGIEGKHWVAVNDDKYKYPEEMDMAANYSFPAYELTWNPTYLRVQDIMPQDVVDTMALMGDSQFLFKGFAAGFDFVSDKVTSEQAKNNDIDSLARPLQNGMIAKEKILEEINNIQRQRETSGYMKIIAEKQAQIEAFMLANPYEE